MAVSIFQMRRCRWSPCGRDREVEVGAVAGEVVRQLDARLGEQFVGFRIDPGAEGVGGRPVPVMPKVDAGERVAVGDHGELAQSAVDDRSVGCSYLVDGGTRPDVRFD